MKAIFYDSDCISCFLIINHADFFKKLFDEIIITEQVYEELMEIHTPKIIRNELKKLLNENFAKIQENSIYSSTYHEYIHLKNGHHGIKIGKG